MPSRFPICDLDGTLIDSDAALAGAFLALGVDPSEITFGHVVEDECARLGLRVDDYLAAYDPLLCQPFPGVDDLIEQMPHWAVCSNKHPVSGHAELERFGWRPDAVMFADSFRGPKRLEPLLERLNLDAGRVLFVGDTDHDRECARSAGVTFVLAGWNPRVTPLATDVVLERPIDVLELLD